MRLSSVRYDDYFLPFVFEEFRANCSSSLAIIKTLSLSGGGKKKRRKMQEGKERCRIGIFDRRFNALRLIRILSDPSV